MEIGVLQLRPTAQSTATEVAFARVKNLKEYLTDVINKQHEIGNTWSDEHFNDEIWLKVGVSFTFAMQHILRGKFVPVGFL